VQDQHGVMKNCYYIICGYNNIYFHKKMYVFEALYTDFIIYSPFSQIHKIIITSHHDFIIYHDYRHDCLFLCLVYLRFIEEKKSNKLVWNKMMNNNDRIFIFM